MTKHTPGPWKVGYQALDVMADPAPPKGPMKVCDIRGWGFLTGKGHGALGLPQEEAAAIQHANAALISAAPDMLAALTDILDCLDTASDHNDLPLPFAGYGRDFITRARDAVFKATGRPHDLQKSETALTSR